MGDPLAASRAAWVQDGSAGPGERALSLVSAFGKTQHAALLGWLRCICPVKTDLLLKPPPSGKVPVP